MKDRIWTPQEISYLKEHRLELRTDIAEFLKRSRGSVDKKIFELNLVLTQKELRTHKKRNQERLRKIAEERTEYERRKKKNPYPGLSVLSGVFFAALNGRSRRSKGKQKDFLSILKDVANALEVTIEDILGDRQFRNIVTARQIFCYVAKDLHPSKTLKEIAEFLGYAQHSMALHAIDNVKIFLKIKDKKFLSVWYKYLQNTQIYKVNATRN